MLEIARVLRFHFGYLSDSGESVCLLQCISLTIINNRIPYEILFGRKPDYNHVRVFRCLAYVLKNKKEGKFDERGRACVFVGYPVGQKGYKVYDPTTREILISRDVMFFENKFSFKEEKESKKKGPQDAVRDDELADTTHGQQHHNDEEKEDDQSVEPQGENQGSDNPRPQGHNGGRHSERTQQLPGHLKDYKVNLLPSIANSSSNPPTGNSVIHLLSNHLNYNKLSHAYSAYLAIISAQDEPKYFSQAIKHNHLKEAMKKEIEALESNGTWTLETLPSGRNAIDS